MKFSMTLAMVFGLLFSITAQNVTVNGYVFETGNRGYLNQVDVDIINKSTGVSVKQASSNKEGYFEVELPSNTDYILYATKQLFHKKEVAFTTSDLEAGKKKFVKIQMEREPGYDFEVTLAPKRDSEDIPVDAIKGAWIEVYNNTTKKEVLNLKEHPELEFNIHFDKGNHYTIMVRKDGFLNKRMEAYVNVEGCILCFDGVGSVRPGVVDNLSEGNEMGVLLANVEMEPLFSGKTFEVENLYYDLGKSTLRHEAKGALINLSTVLKDNPHIMVELGSHTDSRGESDANQKLSDARAKSAVEYLTQNLSISPKVILAAGYGEYVLVNKCADGIKCSEVEHQENRRTEIKILEIDNSKKERKTLAEIRVEEEFLKGIFSDEIETKVEGKSSKPAIEKVEEKKSSKQKIIKEQEQQIEKEEELPVFVDSDIVEEEEFIEKVVEEKNKVVEKPVAKKIETTTITKEVEVLENNTKPTTMKVDQISKTPVLGEESKRVRGNTQSQRALYNELKKKRSKFGTYTGYKIVIQFSKDPISEDHEIYQRHEDLEEYKAPSGSILYMIGDFQEESVADEFLYKTVSSMYPGAYLIQFIDGQRQN